MAIADQGIGGSRSTDGWVLLAYMALAAIAIAASIYLDSGGPGMNEADIMIAAVLP